MTNSIVRLAAAGVFASGLAGAATTAFADGDTIPPLTETAGGVPQVAGVTDSATMTEPNYTLSVDAAITVYNEEGGVKSIEVIQFEREPMINGNACMDRVKDIANLFSGHALVDFTVSGTCMPLFATYADGEYWALSYNPVCAVEHDTNSSACDFKR